MQPDNPVAVVGHNAPPEPTPFERARDEIEKFYGEALLWCDGEPIANQGQADALNLLKNKIREAEKAAEGARKDEKKPHDDAIAEIQGRYNPLIADRKNKTVTGKTTLAIEACDKMLAPWLKKQADEQAAAAKAAREEAERVAREAEAAIRAASAATDLAASEAAEALLRQAKIADADAKRAEKAKPRAAGGGGRASHLRTYYDGIVVDGRAFHAWCVKNDREAMTEHLARRAQALTDAGQRSIPGVEVRPRQEVA